jgi:ATP-dependent exoDNAse (exonuclease V) beta subunit
MNDTVPIADFGARKEALDPERSFIVQAPAGSGKTELLIQRYLVLLSRVAQPEEIAAITFTVKAAAEMRKRVLEALAAARSEERPPEPHRALTWEHARAVLERDRAQGWRLEENAARLRIQTIDALCASLTRQMPVLAAFGAQPEPLENASELYREAARATLALLEEKGGAANIAARLLVHLDNDLRAAEDLIAGMLARRDHWLRNLSGAREREALEAALASECRAQIAKARALFPAKPPVRLPADEDVEGWKQLAADLLTQKGGWRKKDTDAQALSGHEPLREALAALPGLPSPRYSDAQWEALEAITRVLPLAAAELKLVFAAHGRADFVEIAHGASAALGRADAPTDLLLSLDYRIHHILVDEFQDTSFTQFELLEKLAAGWQQGDGRTLFLVGDPMQSIYRFREAEVGLFLRARHGGIGTVHLEPLTLSVNFRSQADIVDWVNRAFGEIMPRAEDIGAGAVPYTRCEPENPAEADAVRVWAFWNGDAEGEAAQVAALAAGAQGEGTVAILVRNRSHLERIVPKLKEEGLRFRAIEIEQLGHRQAVQDLLALTRALAHPADRLAWLAVLRAPWCGLTLADLHALAGTDPRPIPSPFKGEGQGEGKSPPIQQDLFSEIGSGRGSPANPYNKIDIRTLWELVHDEACLARLSADGRERLARVREALGYALANRLRGSLRERVEGAWLALGGPACVEDDTDLEDADIYLDYLEESEEAGEIADIAAFEKGLQDLYALPDLHTDASSPQILTLHKAKGLEFDTVIVPGLGSGTGRDERKLFVWMERPASSLPLPRGEGRGEGGSQLLLAPINPTGGDKDPTYEYIRDLDREKSGHEDGRLLYVAATRAKKHLHLLGDARLDASADEPEPKPGAGSLLAKLWPAVEADFVEAARSSPLLSEEGSARGAGGGAEVNQDLRRLPSDWTLPESPPAAAWSPPVDEARVQDEVEFSWVGETARHVGAVVHRWLQRIAEDELRGWNKGRLAAMRDAFRRELASRGVEDKELAAATARVTAALARSLEDPRGHWLLGPQRDARSEYHLTALIDGARRSLVIDRTFVDAEGKRWIADYKSSSHEGIDVQGFLDREQERYQAQLKRYARALAEGEETMLGLYFPLLGGWRQWRS